jgi:thiopeptide-type bacteriocin biosynthesis protein
MQLDTYHPETGRYGHGEAMAAAERTFIADSIAALAQRQTAAHSGIAAEAIATASLVDLTIGYLGGIDTGMRWLVDQLPHAPAPVDRTLHAATMRLADPRDDWAALRDTPGGKAIVAAWRHRRAALADYRRLLAAQRDPTPVLGSLLHMHHVRMFGIDPDRERILGRLVRAAAQRWIATHPQAAP